MKRDKPTPIELECNMGKDVNGVEHREPWKAYDIDEVDVILADKDAEIKRKEGVGQRWFEQCMEARAENVRLKRALWLGREWRAWCEGEFWLAVESDEPGDVFHLKCTNRIHRTPYEWTTYWHKVEQLCKKMGEKYK